MKLTMSKTTMAKAMMVGVAAGALAFAAPQKAEAQVRFGVVVGAPPVVAYAPGFYGYPPDYYARRDYYERLRCERERHEIWEHRRGFDRGRERWDHDRR